MPEYTYTDRLVIMAEQSLWICHHILREEANSDHGFTKQISELAKAVERLAKEVRDYNDQFEEYPE